MTEAERQAKRPRPAMVREPRGRAAPGPPPSPWANPTALAILVAAVGIAGNALVAQMNGMASRAQERDRAEYARVLEMIKVGDPDVAAANLEMLLESGLYRDESGKLKAYLDGREKGAGAFLPTPSGTVAGPTIDADGRRILEVHQEDAPWLRVALGEDGVREVAGPGSNPRILEYLRTVPLSEALQSSDDTPWNGAYLNWVFDQAGIQGVESLAGRDWERWGEALDEARPGAVVILWRGANSASAQRHVGFYVGPGPSPRTIRVLGGNTRDMIAIGVVSEDRVVGYRWPGVR
jgi:uncharacterized protein (TIGR02594 family)